MKSPTFTATIATLSFLLTPPALAHPGYRVDSYYKRQAVETVDGNIIPPLSALTSGYPLSQTTSALASIPTAGTPSLIQGAPPIPDSG